MAVQYTCHGNTVGTLFVSTTLLSDYDAYQCCGYDRWVIIWPVRNSGQYNIGYLNGMKKMSSLRTPSFCESVSPG